MVLLESDRMARRMYTDVPEKYDTQAPALAMEMSDIIDAIISVEAGEDPQLLADIPPERFAKRSKAAEGLSKKMMERGIKQVHLGNDLYPTAARAAEFGISQTQLSEIFWSGVNVDYGVLESMGLSIRNVLESAREVRLTNANGTDLRLQVTGRKVYVSDGKISESEAEQGGAAVSVWLPAGEVYVTPVPGTAEGTVVIDQHVFQGKEIKNLRLDFEDGKLTMMTADSGLEPLKKRYDAANEGKELFGAIDIGINPNVQVVPGSKMVAWMPAGMVTVALGNNEWAGGENSAGFGLAGHLPGSTLMVDGTPIVENGNLKIAPTASGG